MRVVGAPWGHQSAGIFWAFKQGARRHIGDFGASGTVRRTSNFAGPNNKRANFLKEAVSHGPACFSKSPSPASKGPKPSAWSHLRGVVTPGARQSQVDSRRSPMSSRPSSPRSEETKSSLPASPEVSLSPSRLGYQDSWQGGNCPEQPPVFYQDQCRQIPGRLQPLEQSKKGVRKPLLRLLCCA